MSSGEDWLLRPVGHGWCKYTDLIDGTLSLEDVAVMNEAINVAEENRARIARAFQR